MDLNKLLIGTWSGNYNTGNEECKLELKITDYDNGVINAIFSFSKLDDMQNGTGSYFMVGSFSDDNSIQLTGDQWIDKPTGYYFLDINGIFCESNMTITDDSCLLSVTKKSDDIGIVTIKQEISDEGYLSMLNPYRTKGLKGYLKNNIYSTLEGSGYEHGYVATSGGVSYDLVISVCSYSPFDLIYNLENKYTFLNGKVGFDDITPSGQELFGVKSFFQGEATVIFLYGETVLDRIEISTSDLPKEFNLSVSGVDQLIIHIEFPYYNDVLDNFNKYFNLIEVELK